MDQIIRYFLRLGATGFGGPVALVARMEADLVAERAWFSPEEFAEGLALAQLAPGPLAAQLATYLGWRRGGIRGATLASVAFVLPSFLIVLAFAAVYVEVQDLSWLHAALYGAGAAVIPIVARAAVRLARRSLANRPVAWMLAITNGTLVAATGREWIVVVVLSGLLLAGMRRSGVTLRSIASPLQLLVFFAKSGAVVFGSGLAILPFLHDGVVREHAWLTEQQFLDAISVAMLTPGPVVITVAFIGFIVAGVVGAIAAATGVFAPMYFMVVLLAPRYRALVKNDALTDFIAGVTAAAIGALLGGVVVLAEHTIGDRTAAVIALIAMLFLLIFRRIPEPLLLLGAGIAGMLVGHRGG